MFAGCNLLCYLVPGRLAPAPLKPTQVPSPKPEGRQQEASLSSAPYYPAMFANRRRNEGQFLINGPRQNACAGRLPAALRPGVRLLGHEPGPDPGPWALGPGPGTILTPSISATAKAGATAVKR